MNENKLGYKMYKSGRHWVIVALAFGVFTVGSQTVQANAADISTKSANSTSTNTSTDKNIPSDASTSGTATSTDDTATSGTATSTDDASTSGTATSTDDTATSGTANSTDDAATSDTATSTDDASTSGTATSTNDTATSGTTTSTNDAATSGTAISTDDIASSDGATTTAASENTTTPPANVSDLTAISAQKAWEAGYDGTGMVIAVIDSGIDAAHKDYNLTNADTAKISESEAKQKIAELGYGQYISAKIPFAYNYADADNNNIKNTTIPHGQGVSGLAAANGQANSTDEYIKGAAPEAQILMLRVYDAFDDEDPNQVAQAIYDAVDLGADVINMSLGLIGADLNSSIEQEAVNYATAHGVSVVVAGGNSGHAGSTSKVPTNSMTGTNVVSYDPENSGLMADPGTTIAAITVADQGTDGSIDPMSSWGPTSDYTLKPDVAAPGTNVNWLANDNGYAVSSGTSLASPYVAGAAALVKQGLTENGVPEADIVTAVKLTIMNTATIDHDQKHDNAIVSPRQQGAGLIDVAAAAKATVTIAGDENVGSKSLHSIQQSTAWDWTLTNYGDTDVTYQISATDVYTEAVDADGMVYDTVVTGAQLQPVVQSITVKAHSTATVATTLAISDEVSLDEPLEGFVLFTAGDGSVLSTPYLAYYGDLTHEDIFDKLANDDTNQLGGTYFVDGNNYVLGLGDQLTAKVGAITEDGTMLDWRSAINNFQSDKVAISPNGDGDFDSIRPILYLKENAEELTASIVDTSGKEIRTLETEKGIQRASFAYGIESDSTFSATLHDIQEAFGWDGRVYDLTSGQLVTAADGKYYLRLTATLINDGDHKVQSVDYPVIVDTLTPEVSDLTYDATTHTLQAQYRDTGAGFLADSVAELDIDSAAFAVPLNNSGSSSGTLVVQLNDLQIAALEKSQSLITLKISDAANNIGKASITVKGTDGPAIINAIGGEALDTSSPDYDAVSQTYTLRGYANADFYLNGTLVKVDNGQFAAPIKVADATKVILSNDADGQEVVGYFSTSTDAAMFSWQQVDGQTVSVPIASVTGYVSDHTIYSVASTSDTFTVQANVNYSDGTKAYAKDLNTGTTYTGTVKNGVATFTGEFSEGTDSVLLYGWSENKVPLLGELSTSYNTIYLLGNTIQVTRDAAGTTRPVYTSQQDLNAPLSQGTATVDDISSPIVPAGHDQSTTIKTPNTSYISFDGLRDMAYNYFGPEALAEGSYNEAEGTLTITGHVTDDVASLVVLTNSPDENDSANVVDLAPDGSFSLKVPIAATEDRPLAYIINTKGDYPTTLRGELELFFDSVVPTLEVNGTASGTANTTTVYIDTDQTTYTVSGTANDNLGGYAVYVNGDAVGSKLENSGYNYISDFFTDTAGNVWQTTANSYGALDFTKTYALNTTNDQTDTTPGDGIYESVFNVRVVDVAGNVSYQQMIVRFHNSDDAATIPDQGATPDNQKQANTTAPTVWKQERDNGKFGDKLEQQASQQLLSSRGKSTTDNRKTTSLPQLGDGSTSNLGLLGLLGLMISSVMGLLFKRKNQG